MIKKDKIILIGGITATGKTDLSIFLAKRFNGEIINADSRQVYRYLNIGTAKEPIEKQFKDGSVLIQNIKHHQIDVLNPDEEFNLSIFLTKAKKIIDAILKRKKIPIIVGGTGMYLDSIAKGFTLSTEKKDSQLRRTLSEKTVQELQTILKDKSMKTFKSLTNSDQKNSHRLIRAIERSEQLRTSNKNIYDSLYLIPKYDISSIEKKIRARVEQMFHEGLLEENVKLREKGYTTDLNSMRSIGYKEFDQYFEGKADLQEVKNAIILHTRQYAKRQITWFKRNKNAVIVTSKSEAEKAVSIFLSNNS